MEHLRLFSDVMEMYSRHYRSYGDYSVTSLIDTPRRVHLLKRYGEIATANPRYQVGSFIGTAVHALIEKYLRMKYSDVETVELEKTVAWAFTFLGKTKILTGKFDVLYDQKDLIDNKVVNVWAKIFDPEWKKYTEQQNFYAYLLHLRGIDLKTINIEVWYKDWIEGNALRDRTYPQDSVQEYQLPLWDWDITEKLLTDRLCLLIDCEHLEDEQLPSCSPEDRWERFPKGETSQYAIMKSPKAKRATRVLPTMQEAVKVARTIKGIGADSFIEVRHAVRKKCEKYCKINSYCDHYVDYCKKKKTNTLNEIVPIKEIIT